MSHVLHDFPIRLCIPREVTVGIRLVMRGIMLALGIMVVLYTSGRCISV